MSIFATVLVLALGQNIQLERPLQPEKAFVWTSAARPESSLAAGAPIGEGWTEAEWPLENNELPLNHWLALSVKVDRPGCMMLTCAGHKALACNQINHPADPGAIGAMTWPVPMEAGENWIFIKGTGKRLMTSFRPVAADNPFPVYISQYDRAIPQAIDLTETNAVGSMLVLNITGEPISDVNLWARCTFEPNQKYVGRVYPEDWKPGEWTAGESTSIPAWGFVKMEFKLKGPPPFKRDPQPYPFELQARINEEVIGKGFVNLAVREKSDRTWHTYKSEIDGSIQRWIHLPPAGNPDKQMPALFVLPHVQQTPQNHALGFEPSNDHHIIVCWGRRPSREAYKQELHLESLLETIRKASQRHNVDTTRTGILGFGDAGLCAFELQKMHPTAFTGIGVVSCFPPIDPSTGASTSLDQLPGRLAMRWGSECHSVPPDAEYRYEALADDGQLFIDVVPGEGEWWGREAVDHPPLHQWILDGQGNLQAIQPRAVVLEGDNSELWSTLDAQPSS